MAINNTIIRNVWHGVTVLFTEKDLAHNTTKHFSIIKFMDLVHREMIATTTIAR